MKCIYRIYCTVLPLDLYGCETVTREEHKLRVYEDRVQLRTIYGHKWEEVPGSCRKLHNQEHHQTSLKWSNQTRWDGWHTWTTQMRTEIQTGFWWWNQKERDHLADLGIDGGIILKTNFRKIGLNSMDWIHKAQDMDKWQAIINTTMNLQVP